MDKHVLWVRPTLGRMLPILQCTTTCLYPTSGASRNKVLNITQARATTLSRVYSDAHRTSRPHTPHRVPHTYTNYITIFPTRPHSRIVYSDNHTHNCRNSNTTRSTISGRKELISMAHEDWIRQRFSKNICRLIFSIYMFTP